MTTIEQLLGELVCLDRHPGVRYPVLVEFPRCRHTVIFAVPRLQLTGTTYAERLVALWSRGCPVCADSAAHAAIDAEVEEARERAHRVLRRADRVLAGGVAGD